MSETPSETTLPAVLLDQGPLLALDKPSGMLVHNSAWAGGPREVCLVHHARDLAGGDVWPLHRLDRGTSGVVLFLRDRDALEPWRAALAAGCKRYVAAVRGRSLAPLTVIKTLADEQKRPRTASTDLWPLATSEVDRVSLVAARLWSGRTHQVRRHLNHASHPVLGDANHGDSRFNRGFAGHWGVGRLQLHAAGVALRSPDDGATVQVVAPLDPILTALWTELFGAEQVDAVLGALDLPDDAPSWAAHDAARPEAWLG